MGAEHGIRYAGYRRAEASLCGHDPSCLYYDHRWLYRKGRHNKGEFPVVVVRKHLMDLSYKVWVSGQSKIGIEAFILAMFPGARKKRDASYLTMVDVFGKETIKKLIAIIDQEKKMGLRRHGGDPDLFVQNSQNQDDRFFVEVKAEAFTITRPYGDDLNDQQRLVFPLIEKYLECQVLVARVRIVQSVKASS